MKKIERKLKLQIKGAKATPAPPIGPALGQAGINIGDFVNRFNEATKEMAGSIVPVEILVYEDRSFDFVLKTPLASQLLLKALGKPKGSGKNLVNGLSVRSPHNEQFGGGTCAIHQILQPAIVAAGFNEVVVFSQLLQIFQSI